MHTRKRQHCGDQRSVSLRRLGLSTLKARAYVNRCKVYNLVPRVRGVQIQPQLERRGFSLLLPMTRSRILLVFAGIHGPSPPRVHHDIWLSRMSGRTQALGAQLRSIRLRFGSIRGSRETRGVTLCNKSCSCHRFSFSLALALPCRGLSRQPSKFFARWMPLQPKYSRRCPPQAIPLHRPPHQSTFPISTFLLQDRWIPNLSILA
ncbi:hypothetical protein JB92DRAFT_1115562 [Gautieria morchelliformis]|nr:hypothetical protein JB92DRAFT_1115562 [Gautieria morchelliformis]